MLDFINNKYYCLFCGKVVQSRFEEYNEYHECDCDDSKLNRQITDKIKALERSRPKPKFRKIKTESIRKI